MDKLSAKDIESLLQTAIQCCPCFKTLYEKAVADAFQQSPPLFDYHLEQTRYNFIIDPFQHLSKGDIPRFINLIDEFTVQIINKIEQSVNMDSPKEIVQKAFETLVSCFRRSMELFAGCYEAKCIELREDSHIMVAQQAILRVGELYLRKDERTQGQDANTDLETAYVALSPITLPRWNVKGKGIAKGLQAEENERASFDG
jgi:hypothetical protein